MKKKFYLFLKLCSFIFIGALLILSINANTNTLDEDHLSVKLEDTTITTEYLKKDVYTVPYETTEEKGFIIYKNSSNDILERISYNKDNVVTVLSPYSVRPLALIIKEFNSDIAVSGAGQTAYFRSTVVTDFYYYNNNRQINKILSHNFRAISSGNFTIENISKHALPNPRNRFPTTRVDVYVAGTATVRYGTAQSAGFKLEFFKGAGFDYSGSINSNTYFRKYISKSYTINLY